MRSRRSRYPARVVHGVNATKVGARGIPDLAHERRCGLEVGRGVVLAKAREDLVVDRLHRRGNEEAPRVAERREIRPPAEQVLDLDGGVEGEEGMLRVHRLHDPQGMGRTVEEVRITERDVLRAGRDLLPDVGEDHLARHHPEAPVVHRDDGAVAAEVLAAPARLREPDDPLLAARQLEPGVLVERGKAAPVRNAKARSCRDGWTVRRLPLRRSRGPSRASPVPSPAVRLTFPACRHGSREGFVVPVPGVGAGAVPAFALAKATSAGSTSPPSTASAPSSRK